MQKLARLHAAAKGSKMVSDIAKEEYEIDENVSIGGNKRANSSSVSQRVSDSEADELRAPGRQQRAKDEAARKEQELKDTLRSRAESLMKARSAKLKSQGIDPDSVKIARSKRNRK